MKQGDYDRSQFLFKSPCDRCGSSDAKAHYADGSAFCFSCQGFFKPGDSMEEPNTQDDTDSPTRWVTSTYQDIPDRKLKETVCSKFGYGIGEFDGEKCHVATYREPGTGRKIAQKIRRAGKRFSLVGDGKSLPFWGQHLYQGGKSVVITEGEIDALSVANAQGDGKWPVVSLPNGAQSAVKVVKAQMEWLEGFEKIVLCFDQDEPGAKATQEVAAILPPGKAYVMTLPYKDANETLKKVGVGPITEAYWNAKGWRPDGLRKLSDLREQAKAPITYGRPWCFPSLTEGTFGRRPGIYIWGAGTGVGKTDFFTQQIIYDVMELKQPVGVFFLEQNNIETVRRLCGKLRGRPFHIPDSGWTQEEYEKAVDEIADTDLVHLNDSFGQTDWNVIASRIRFLKLNYGVEHHFVDHLTALADPSKERESLETIMENCASLTTELGLYMHLISHLATPSDGKSHEEGARVMLRHFKGARAIGFWADFAFGIERDKGNEDPILRNLTTVRCVKDRYTGRFDGETFHTRYDRDTTRLEEVSKEFLESGADEDEHAPF